MSAPLPAREARDPEAKADLRRGSMSSPTGSYPSPQTLNPSPLPSDGRVQRAQPSLAGGWGYPPNPYPLRFPSGKWTDVGSGDGRMAMRPYEMGPEHGGAPHPAGESRRHDNRGHRLPDLYRSFTSDPILLSLRLRFPYYSAARYERGGDPCIEIQAACES